jgi:hypothetical protein
VGGERFQGGAGQDLGVPGAAQFDSGPQDRAAVRVGRELELPDEVLFGGEDLGEGPGLVVLDGLRDARVQQRELSGPGPFPGAEVRQ